jgi:hypothetical protein
VSVFLHVLAGRWKSRATMMQNARRNSTSCA